MSNSYSVHSMSSSNRTLCENIPQGVKPERKESGVQKSMVMQVIKYCRQQEHMLHTTLVGVALLAC